MGQQTTSRPRGKPWTQSASVSQLGLRCGPLRGGDLRVRPEQRPGCVQGSPLSALSPEAPRTAALCCAGASQRRDLRRLLSALQRWTVQPCHRPPCPCPTRGQKHTLTETSGLRRPDCASCLFYAELSFLSFLSAKLPL